MASAVEKEDLSAPCTPELTNANTAPVASPAKRRRLRRSAISRELWRRTRWQSLDPEACGEDLARSKRARVAASTEAVAQTDLSGWVVSMDQVRTYFREEGAAVVAEEGKKESAKVRELQEEVSRLQELLADEEANSRDGDSLYGACRRCASLDLLLSSEESCGRGPLQLRIVVLEKDLAWAIAKLEDVCGGAAAFYPEIDEDPCVACGGLLDEEFAAASMGDFLVLTREQVVPSFGDAWICGTCSSYQQFLDDVGVPPDESYFNELTAVVNDETFASSWAEALLRLGPAEALAGARSIPVFQAAVVEDPEYR